MIPKNYGTAQMKTLSVPLILFISLALIQSYYAGETIILEHDLGTDNLIWTIADNSTSFIPEVTYNATHIKDYFPFV